MGRFFFIPLGHLDPRELLARAAVLPPLDEEDLAFAVVDVVLHLRGGEAEHDGDDDEAALGSGGVDLHPLHAVVPEGGEPVPLLHAHG